jgi:serine/threonine-protein kinase
MLDLRHVIDHLPEVRAQLARRGAGGQWARRDARRWHGYVTNLPPSASTVTQGPTPYTLEAYRGRGRCASRPTTTPRPGKAHMIDDSTRSWKRAPGAGGDPLVARREPPTEPEYMALVENEGQFAQRYRELSMLGHGGMGEVMLVADRRTGRDLALKRIDRTRKTRAQRERFLREARIQAQLDHPTIVPVYEIGIDDEGLEYFTMKCARGVTLEQILQQLLRGDAGAASKYSLHVRLGIFRQVCQGVEYAHGRGIIHRDLKPANIMVGELGEVYVIDWGIAKVGSTDQAGARSSSFRTGGNAGLGTPGYMAPEQIFEAEAVDVRADVYSLGSILFELLALTPLHPANEVQELLDATQRDTDDARVGARNPELQVPPELEQVCVLATRRDRDQRLPTVAALHEVIARYLEGDRDLALRRALAERHMTAASSAYAQALAGGDPAGDARRTALREAGHALALDPPQQAAIDLITGLMARPPEHVPAEVAKELQGENLQMDLSASRRGIAVYASMMLFLLFLPFVEISSWPWMVAMGAPLLVALVTSILRGRRPRTARAPLLATSSVLFSIAATSAIAGPYVIMPGLLVAFATITMAVVPYLQQRPRAWGSCCVAAALIPMALEAFDLLPVGFSVEANRVVIDIRFAAAAPLTIRLALVAFLMAPLVAGLMFAYRSATRLERARERLILHMWHLRQLAPGAGAT